MSDFTMFMAGSAVEDELVEYVASKRFKEKGKPISWKIKSIDSDLDETIRKECTKKVPINGKRGQYTPELDMDKYMSRLCTMCTVYPDLNNAELQDSYGVKSPEALLKKMLKVGEYMEYKAKVMEVNGFDLSMDELVDEAKNS